MCLSILNPLVPVAYGKLVVNAGLVFLCFPFRCDFFVCFIVCRARKNCAGEEDRFAVRTPLWRTRSRGECRDPYCFTTIRHVKHVNLIYFVAFTLRRESEFLTIRTPGRSTFPAFPPLLVNVNRRGLALPSAGTIHRSDT